MFIHVTWRATILAEDAIILGIGYDFNGEFPMYLEPLRPLAPIGNGDCREHFRIVPATPYLSWIII
jgi:hypothetical protein